MTAEEMWKQSGLAGEYDAWSFGDDTDGLAALVRAGVKTATSSAYDLYEAEGEDLPQAGDTSVILDSRDDAVCIIRTTRVYTVPFDKVTAEHAFREGEGGRSLEYWRQVHEAFFQEELASAGLEFSGDSRVVCEEFEVVYP